MMAFLPWETSLKSPLLPDIERIPSNMFLVSSFILVVVAHGVEGAPRSQVGMILYYDAKINSSSHTLKFFIASSLASAKRIKKTTCSCGRGFCRKGNLTVVSYMAEI